VSTVTRRAPAKINLYLRVTGRRPDGYHEIDSLFLPLELGDVVKVQVTGASEVRISCSCPGHPDLEGPENLAARAAARLLERAGLTARVDITVEKRIWIAAGLGGGSSDAAAVLLALRDLLGVASGLGEVARGLGADVPFFIAPRPARATGVGDRLTPLADFPGLELALVNPGVRLSTAAVYRALAGTPSAGWTPPPLDPPANLPELLHNDLTVPASSLCPEVEVMHEALRRQGALGTGLSGSGPTVFGVFLDAPSAAAAVENIADTTGFSAVSTRSLCS
jgi:4-diphosphocytidyl-2-C-methyl-D-erythritol kinase